MATLNSAIAVQNEQNLIEMSQRMLQTPNKEALTQGEKRLGDRAFAELLGRYNRWIWKQINSVPSLDPDDAYSAALEGFIKAIATFDLTSGNALASWAYHCVRGALRTVLRKEQGQTARVEKLAATTALVYEDEFEDPYEQEQLHQSVEKLHQATAQLSKTAQQIVSKRNAGMKFAAIGAELGKSADAVRMAYNRAITALGGMLSQPSEFSVESALGPTVLQEKQSTGRSKTNWMKRLWERSKSNVRLQSRVPILSGTVGKKSMTKRLLLSTGTLRHKPRSSVFTKFLDSPALKYVSWLTVALLVLYRMLMGEWLVLLVCGVGGTIAALLWQHWRAISKKSHRRQLLFGLCVLLSWCLFTIHLPAHALFFDTLETGLTTLFARFGVADTTSFPLWIGALFRILGIVFIGILALRFGRSRDEDDEGTRQITGKVVHVIGALVIFDAMLELFTG